MKLHNKKSIAAAFLAITIIISGALSLLVSQSPMFNNLFTLGQINTTLIETFNGITYTKGDAETIDTTMEPGITYEKTAKVQFDGTGSAFAYIVICIPNLKSSNTVNSSGVPVSEEVDIITLHTQNIGTGDTEWTKVTEFEELHNKYIVFGYNTKLLNEPGKNITETSPYSSISIANMIINNNAMIPHYDVSVTAYTLLSGNDSDTLQSVWENSRIHH